MSPSGIIESMRKPTFILSSSQSSSWLGHKRCFYGPVNLSKPELIESIQNRHKRLVMNRVSVNGSTFLPPFLSQHAATSLSVSHRKTWQLPALYKPGGSFKRYGKCYQLYKRTVSCVTASVCRSTEEVWRHLAEFRGVGFSSSSGRVSRLQPVSTRFFRFFKAVPLQAWTGPWEIR